MYKLILINIIELTKYIISFSFFFNGKFFNNKRKILSSMLTIISIIMLTFIFKSDDLVISMLAFLPILLYGYAGRIKNKILLFGLTIIAINYVDTICYSIIGYIRTGELWWFYIHNSNQNKIYEGLLSLFIVVIVSFIIHIKNNKKWLEINISIWQWVFLLGAMLGFYIILITMILYILYKEPVPKARLSLLIGISSTITITCIIAFFIYSNYLKQQNDMHLENVHLYDENLGLRLSYYDQVQGNYEKVRQFRHDFRHHLAAIEGLIQGKEYSELEDYVVQLSKQDVKLKNERMRYTGNYMIDAIIVGIVANDNFKDVDFQFDGMLPTKIRIRDMDICGVLANGLENALEACMKNNDRKIVALKAGCFENIISFQIKNTYDSKLYDELSKGRFDSTKTDDGHGYGIRNMQRIVKEYNGKLEYSVDQEWVTADIYMQQKDENQPSETTNNQ